MTTHLVIVELFFHFQSFFCPLEPKSEFFPVNQLIKKEAGLIEKGSLTLAMGKCL